MQVVCVVGRSGAGKTTLVERLIGTLRGDARVGTVKSIHHDVDPDTPGTDTHRHSRAGADAVVGVTPARSFEVRAGGKGTDRDRRSEPAALVAHLDRFADEGFDVVLVEGFAGSELPKVLVGNPAGKSVVEPVVERVPDGGVSADRISQVAETLLSRSPYHTATSLATSLREGTDADDGSVTATLTATFAPTDDPIPTGRDSTTADVERAVASRPGVTAAVYHPNPPVAGGGALTAFLSVLARDPTEAFRAARDGRRLLRERRGAAVTTTGYRIEGDAEHAVG